MNKTIEGKSNIKATVICDSVSSVSGKRITTMCLEYPRLIHSEFMTHRMFSRNAASSRAIPFDKMVDTLKGIPVRFGAANKGMQDKGEDYERGVYYANDIYAGTPQDAWTAAKEAAIEVAKGFYNTGYHKQVYNRLLEPFQMMKTIVTATEWNNFFWLRLDEAADPTIQELACCMKQAMDTSKPQELSPGQWHLPYVGVSFGLPEVFPNVIQYYIEPDMKHLTLEQARKVSAARCAAVSFRNEDYGLEKCLQVYDRLVGGERKHSSALEHQATPMWKRTLGNEDDNISSVNNPMFPQTWEKGVTCAARNDRLWSGNFESWIQYRQLIPNHVKEG